MIFNSLPKLLESTTLPVFQDPDRVVPGKEFLSGVRSIFAQLHRLPQSRVGIYCSSTCDFSQILLASLLAGKTPILLPNAQKGFVDAVVDWMELLITDQQIAADVDVLSLTSMDKKTISGQLPEIHSDSATLELFTSGSTGQPKRVVKRLCQLENEVQAHEVIWGKKIKSSMVVSTVSHQHIYGLLFKVLGPLFFGRSIWDPLCHYPEQWLGLTKHKNAITLISSPAHLKRAHSLVDIATARKSLLSVFSSGGPLEPEDSRIVFQQLKQPVIEVYGSTETGGVAFRSQYRSDMLTPSWQAMPGVDVAQDKDSGCLMVKSAFVDENTWFRTSDLVEMVSNKEFMLLGRADRVVKVEEKRVSLTEIENGLTKSYMVDSAAAVALPKKRTVIACLVVLSAEGLRVYAEKGKAAVSTLLRNHLSQYVEKVVLPRKWRLVSKLPANEQGKLRQEELLGYFSDDYQPPTQPSIEHQEINGDRANVRIRIPTELDYFNGHFPSKPILPGVVQIEWAGALGSELFKIPVAFKDLEKVKFHEFIFPGDVVDITLSFTPGKNSLKFTYSSTRGLHSSGCIVFRN